MAQKICNTRTLSCIPPAAASIRPRARRPRRTRPSSPHTHPQDNSIDCANGASARSGCACRGKIWCSTPAACPPTCGAGMPGGADCDCVGAGPLPDIPPPPVQNVLDSIIIPVHVPPCVCKYMYHVRVCTTVARSLNTCTTVRVCTTGARSLRKQRNTCRILLNRCLLQCALGTNSIQLDRKSVV